MRTKDDLFALEDIATLFQYLYMDGNHTVTFHNGLTDLRIRMDEEYGVHCRNLSFPDLPETDFSEQMTPSYVLGIVDVLKNTAPVEFPDSFANRWEEVRMITKTNLALNRPRK